MPTHDGGTEITLGVCNFIFAAEVNELVTYIDNFVGGKITIGSYNDWVFYDPFLSGSTWSSHRNGDGCRPTCELKDTDCSTNTPISTTDVELGTHSTNPPF